MPFRFWRSKAFWLGLPGLVFLIWAWWHSMGHTAYVRVVGRGIMEIRHMGGEVFLMGWGETSSPPREFQFGSAKRTKLELKMETAWQRELQRVNPGYHAVFLPYPYLLLTYLSVWAGVLGWRWRSHAKAARLPADS